MAHSTTPKPSELWFKIDWEQAACKGKPTDWFYPTLTTQPETHLALALCAVCPIRPECYVYAVEAKEVGVWGGENFSKPSRLPTVHREICGTTAGYRLHQKMREQTCRPCRTARNEYEKQHKELREKAAS